MGYSSRYHVASLAAVFIALAVGILIGASLGSDVISGAADRLEDDLKSDLDQVRAENAELHDELAFEEGFSSELAPAVMADRLALQDIALIGLGDIDTTTLRDDVEGALDPSGAALTLIGSVQEPPDADALTGQLLSSSERREEGSLELAAERAGRLLAGGGDLPSDLRSTLMSEFSGNPEGLDGVVLARARPEDLSDREAEEVEQLEVGLIRGLLDAGMRVVGAEREDTDPSSIEFFDSHGLSSVDSIDQLPGKVALVLALDGADGSYGVKDTADSLLPDLIDPPSTPGADAG
jgi:Copper transport outer membrane protein, MctB